MTEQELKMKSLELAVAGRNPNQDILTQAKKFYNWIDPYPQPIEDKDPVILGTPGVLRDCEKAISDIWIEALFPKKDNENLPSSPEQTNTQETARPTFNDECKLEPLIEGGINDYGDGKMRPVCDDLKTPEQIRQDLKIQRQDLIEQIEKLPSNVNHSILKEKLDKVNFQIDGFTQPKETYRDKINSFKETLVCKSVPSISRFA